MKTLKNRVLLACFLILTYTTNSKMKEKLVSSIWSFSLGSDMFVLVLTYSVLTSHVFNRSKCHYMAVTATLMPSWLPVMWILSLSLVSGYELLFLLVQWKLKWPETVIRNPILKSTLLHNLMGFIFSNRNFWQPYDFLALIPVIEGAGGVITDWKGNHLHWEASSTSRATSMPFLSNLFLFFPWKLNFESSFGLFSPRYIKTKPTKCAHP